MIARSVLLRMRNVLKQKLQRKTTHFMFSNFLSENRVVYEIMWKKYCRSGQTTDDNIIRSMSFACGITKATNSHSEYVILVAFPLKQWYANAAYCRVIRALRGLCNCVLWNPTYSKSVQSLNSRWMTEYSGFDSRWRHEVLRFQTAPGIRPNFYRAVPGVGSPGVKPNTRVTDSAPPCTCSTA